MTLVPFTSPDHVLAQGTMDVKHSISDLVTHICAVKQWRMDSDTGAVFAADGSLVAANTRALADIAQDRGWVVDRGRSRIVRWPLIG